MTFKKFEKLLKTEYPEAEACPHGKFGVRAGSDYVKINFKPNGKCYIYRGSYIEVLNKVGVKAVTKQDVERAEWELKYYKECHGKRSVFSLFADIDTVKPMDFSNEIKYLEDYIETHKSGEYIIV